MRSGDELFGLQDPVGLQRFRVEGLQGGGTCRCREPCAHKSTPQAM